MHRQSVIEQILASALGGVLLLLGMWVFGLTLTHPEASEYPLDFFVLGLIGMSVLWGIGRGFACRSQASADAQLFAITPLWLGLYLSRSMKRLAIPLFTVYILAPGIAAYALSRPMPFRTDFQASVPLIAHFCVLYILAFVVPLNEAFSERSWSGGFFFIRVLLEKLWLGFAFLADRIARLPGPLLYLLAIVTALVLYGFWRPILGAVGEGGQDFLRTLLDGGNIGLCIYYLLLPLAALFYIHQPETPLPLQYAFIGLSALILVASLGSLRKRLAMPPREFEEGLFDRWTDERDEIEYDEERAQEEAERASRPLANLRADGFPAADEDCAPPLEPGETLEYDHTRPPEAQLLRHLGFWQGTAPPLGRYARIGCVLVVGTIWFYLHGKAGSNWLLVASLRVILLGVSVAFLGIASVVWRRRCESVIWWTPCVPLRWSRLVWAIFRPRDRWTFMADILAALLFTIVSGLPAYFAALFLVAIMVLRVIPVLATWLTCHAEAGGAPFVLLYGLAVFLVSVVGAFMWLFLMFLIGDFPEDPTKMSRFFALFVTWVVGCLFAGLLVCVLLASAWKGTQVTVPPPSFTSVLFGEHETE